MNREEESYPMLEVEEAVERFLGHFQPLEAETVPVLEALDRVLAEDVVAEIDIPPLANTAMDGYAVRCDDTGGAPILARLPLDPDVAAMCDAGEIESVARPEVEALSTTLTGLVSIPRQSVVMITKQHAAG